MSSQSRQYVLPLARLSMADVAIAGGKNASLGELIQNLEQAGVRVAHGFATTVAAYWRFIEANALERPMREALGNYLAGRVPLETAAAQVRALLLQGEWPSETAADIEGAYAALAAECGV